jgi:hypothetical protein
MRLVFAIVGMLAACDGGGDEDEDYYTEEGECDAPEGAAEIGGEPVNLGWQSCLVQDAIDLQVIESDAEWQALFSCEQPLPDGIDLATRRAAVVSIMCAPTTFRFAAETDGEVVVGIKTGISGACLGDLLVMPLPRSTKPVRLARCWDECHGECPPVP